MTRRLSLAAGTLFLGHHLLASATAQLSNVVNQKAGRVPYLRSVGAVKPIGK